MFLLSFFFFFALFMFCSGKCLSGVNECERLWCFQEDKKMSALLITSFCGSNVVGLKVLLNLYLSIQEFMYQEGVVYLLSVKESELATIHHIDSSQCSPSLLSCVNERSCMTIYHGLNLFLPVLVLITENIIGKTSYFHRWLICD